MFGGDNGGSNPFPDITRMSITPTPPPLPRTSKSNHTRSQSESFLTFPNNLLDDSELDLFDSTMPFTPSPQLNSDTNPFARQRSFSVDDDFFDGLGINYQGLMDGEGKVNDGGGVRAHRRRHSFSVDESVDVDGLFDVECGVDGVKKAMDPEKLAHLALVDPKKAKRILANRQSAARSKERKIRYTSELERKVQTLQTEATTLSAQVSLLERDTNGLTSENRELKLRLQALEQQAHLKEALNETLKSEVYRLRLETGQIPTTNGHSFSNRLPPQYSQTSSHFYGSQQAQLQTQQLQSNNQILNQSAQSSFMDFSN